LNIHNTGFNKGFVCEFGGEGKEEFGKERKKKKKEGVGGRNRRHMGGRALGGLFFFKI